MSEGSEKGAKPKPTNIVVNNRKVTLPDDHATGAAIKSAAGVPPTFQLFDAKGKAIADDKEIRVHEGDKFTAISGQDVS